MPAGTQERGLRFKVHLKSPRTIDDPLARKIVGLAAVRMKAGHEFERMLRHSRAVISNVPYFSAANYTQEELHGKRSKGRGRTPRGTRFGGIAELRERQGRDPSRGGELRESLRIDVEESTRDLFLEVLFKTDYLGYLFRHGKSRHPGTSVHFTREIQQDVFIPNKMRALILHVMTQLGLGRQEKKQVSIRKAGLIVR